MLSNLPVKTVRFDNTFRNLIISNLIGQFNLVMLFYFKIVIILNRVLMFVILVVTILVTHVLTYNLITLTLVMRVRY